MERKYEGIEVGRKYEGWRERGGGGEEADEEGEGGEENIKKEEGDEETRSTLRL